MKRTKKTMAMAAALMLAGSLVGCRDERVATSYGAYGALISDKTKHDLDMSDIIVGDTIKDEMDDNKDDADNNKEDIDSGENKLEVSTSDEISGLEDKIVQMKYGVYRDKLDN